jgi:hypothetical protein
MDDEADPEADGDPEVAPVADEPGPGWTVA